MPLGNKRKALAHPTTSTESARKRSKATDARPLKRSRGRPQKNTIGISGDAVPFTVEYPLKPATRRLYLDKDIFIDRSCPDDKTGKLAIDYAIRPGQEWQNMKTYKNVKLLDATIHPGQVIYVAKSNPLPEPPADDAPVEESLSYDRKHYWIAQIAECRAIDGQHVYLRVFWLYWPEELPMGRQPYHGRNEVILSNAIEIIDAGTIVEPVSVQYWSESDDDEKLGYLFWRQTLNLVNARPNFHKKIKSVGHLSNIREHCACRGPYNPDSTMYLCPNQECRTWNHEQCLQDYILSETFDKFSRGELHHESVAVNRPSPQEARSISPNPAEGDNDTISVTPQNLIKKIGSLFGSKAPVPANRQAGPETETQTEPEASTGHQPTGSTISFTPPQSDKERPWIRRFSASIGVEKHGDDKEGNGEEEGAVVAQITDLRKNPEKKTWKEPLSCLRCGAMLA